ncbi:MAG TPA: outer membrane lipoprotein carrier protein LolA, partial [Sporosarcina sp.]|nr:outer membrane lipoprotein carrier protein LolA [Sporosarcina sp.]
NGIRSFMTFGGGDKEFVVVQEPAEAPGNQLAVSIEGDPVDLGFTVAALTNNSIRWEQDGVAFFVASSTLTPDELIEVASSMHPEDSK